MGGREDASEVQVPDSFESLYRQEYNAMVALAYGMTGNRAVAEEVAQDAFLRALRNWDDVGSMASPGGWVRVVTLNLARSRWRRLKVELAALLRLDAGTRVDGGEPDAGAAEFWGEVRRLPSRQAQVLALHYVEDRGVAEIGELLGIADGTVKALLHQARGRLGRQLEAKGWTADGV